MYDLNVVAARYALGLLPSWEMPVAATEALRRGDDGPALRQLAGVLGPTMADAEPLLRQVLAESGIAVRSREQAARHLTRH